MIIIFKRIPVGNPFIHPKAFNLVAHLDEMVKVNAYKVFL